MTHEDAGHYSKKHPEAKHNLQIEQAVKQKVLEGKITCAAAHKVAHELGVSSAEIGIAIDLLEMRIIKCQLGLFGYSPQKGIVKPAEDISPQLKEAIEVELVNNRLSCLSSWEIAKRFGIAKIDVSAACEKLKIKIFSCQLGAF